MSARSALDWTVYHMRYIGADGCCHPQLLTLRDAKGDIASLAHIEMSQESPL